MAWDVTLSDTYTKSYISDTATQAGAAANHADSCQQNRQTKMN